MSFFQGYKTIIYNLLTLIGGTVTATTGTVLDVQPIADDVTALVGGAIALHSLVNLGLRFTTKGKVGEKR